MDKDSLLDEHKENVRRNRMVRSSFWKWSTFLLLAVMIIGVYFYGLPNFGSQSKIEVSERTIAFVNDNLLAGFATADLQSVEEEGDLYKMNLNLISNLSDEVQNATLYVTKDGTMLFPSAIDISEYTYESVVEEENTQTVQVEASNDPIIGNQDAPLTIVEYSDFQCPFCGQAYWTIKLVLEEYSDEVNLVYKNFPIPSHDYAQKAAEAGECANSQGKFGVYHDKLFENQDALTVKDLKQYAADLGLDTEAFNTCLDSDSMAKEVALDKSEGIDLGVSGTPTFYIGEQKFEGNGKFSDFQTIIEEELAKLSLDTKEENSTEETNSSS